MSPVLRSHRRTVLRGGHAIALVHDGRVFDELARDIASATATVHVAQYIWAKGEASDRLVAALAERARAGVACRVVVDPFGSLNFGTDVRPQLEVSGVEVRTTPWMSGQPGGLLGRNHRKLVVVDGRVGYAGGFCVRDDWLGNGEGEGRFRDTSVRVEGPIVGEMQRAFAADWYRAGGMPIADADFGLSPVAGRARAAFVASKAHRLRTASERLHLRLIASARRRLWLANAYFVPTRTILRRLVRQARRGVDVRVLVPGPIHDVPAYRPAQRASYSRLLRGGVRLWEYQAAMMHSKTLLVDDDVVVVGSMNLEPLSLTRLEEDAVIVQDRRVALSLEEAWARDVARSKEILPADAPHVGVHGRVLRWILGADRR